VNIFRLNTECIFNPFGKKETHLNSVEKFHIYKETLLDNQLNDKHTVTYNKIFETVLGKQIPTNTSLPP
jgi:hypothetical protein